MTVEHFTYFATQPNLHVVSWRLLWPRVN
jgi:hypothetical protein